MIDPKEIFDAIKCTEVAGKLDNLIRSKMIILKTILFCEFN